MANLMREIQKIVEGYLNNFEPSDLAYATYMGDSIRIDGKPTPIPMDMVILPGEEDLELSFRLEKEQRNREGELIFTSEPPFDFEWIEIKKLPIKMTFHLQPGDKVLVGKKQGGQEFAILRRLEE